MTSSWLFPPRTREVQLDEAWSFVAQKQKNCDPADPADDPKGDWWDHVADDPEHKLVLAVVPGARVGECAQEVVEEVKERLGDQPPALFTSDEHAASESAIVTAFSRAEPDPVSPRRRGRRRVVPRRHLTARLADATVRKERKRGRVGSIRRSIVLGDESTVAEVLQASVCSRTSNTSFVERRHATDRGQNARKSRRSYRFSKDWQVHEAMTYFTAYRYNFCTSKPLTRQDRDGSLGQPACPRRPPADLSRRGGSVPIAPGALARLAPRRFPETPSGRVRPSRGAIDEPPDREHHRTMSLPTAAQSDRGMFRRPPPTTPRFRPSDILA
jgi:hypothetical protein